MKKIKILNLEVDSELKSFIDKEAIPGTGLSSEDFWSGFDEAVHKLAPVNKKLIEKRDIIQKKIDDWHKNKKDKDFNKSEYINFLRSISYLVDTKLL